jgi:signal transduction histidine kinase
VIVRVIVLEGVDGTDQLLAQVIDITRLKKVEDILKTRNRELQNSNKDLAVMNEELERTNMELDRFIYSASHDLRAPLSSMLGLINLSKMDASLRDNQYLELMEMSVNRLDSFINEVIQFSANERTDLNSDLITDFEAIASEVIGGLKWAKGADKIDIRVLTRDISNFRIDKRRLEMILNNLISNSIKYHDHRKKEQYIEVVAILHHEFLKLEIRDNGIGIPKNQQDKIFDFFYRAHEHSQGAGLGLYIVKQTVTKMKGEVALESKVGEGTSIKIKIPVDLNLHSRIVA